MYIYMHIHTCECNLYDSVSLENLDCHKTYRSPCFLTVSAGMTKSCKLSIVKGVIKETKYSNGWLN